MYLDVKNVPGLKVDWSYLNSVFADLLPREKKWAEACLNSNGYPCFMATLRGDLRQRMHLLHDLVALYGLRQDGYRFRFLPQKPVRWVVHHINFDKLDARPQNLVALPEHVHGRLHSSLACLAERAGVSPWRLCENQLPPATVSGDIVVELAGLMEIIADYRENAARYMIDDCVASLPNYG